MISLRVLDSDFDAFREEQYDVCLFASGYESRCIHVPGLIDPGRAKNALVFGFTEDSTSDNRLRNDAFFEKSWGCKPIPLSGDDEKPIYEHLHALTRSLDQTVHLLMDYSSMSRLWYTAALNWARLAASGRTVIIDFTYSVGNYMAKTRPMVIRKMLSVPGCEGRAYRLRESVAVFGLGFQGLAALCVLDRLEADIVYVFLASPGATMEHVSKAKACNKQLLKSRKTKAILELPLASIETCYRSLAEKIAPHRPDGEITLVPMGPKPHVLASILIAMRFPEVACLRVASNSDTSDVRPTGDIVATRVIVRGEP